MTIRASRPLPGGRPAIRRGWHALATVCLSLALLATGVGLSGGRGRGHQATCTEDELAATPLPEGPAGFVTIKRFLLPAGSKEPVELTYVVGRNSEYVITAHGPGGVPVPVRLTLMDGYRRVLYTNTDKKAKQVLPRIGYACQMTSVVYIQAEAINGYQGCALISLDFKSR